MQICLILLASQALGRHYFSLGFHYFYTQFHTQQNAGIMAAFLSEKRCFPSSFRSRLEFLNLITREVSVSPVPRNSTSGLIEPFPILRQR